MPLVKKAAVRYRDHSQGLHREELGRYDFGDGELGDSRVVQPSIEVELHGYQGPSDEVIGRLPCWKSGAGFWSLGRGGRFS